MSISEIYLVFGFRASSVTVPGTIEGLVYLRPEFTPRVRLTATGDRCAGSVAGPVAGVVDQAAHDTRLN
jgi:hypothetical protein